MLSRTASNLYWIGRYVERADFTTALIEATIRLSSLSAGEAPAATAVKTGWFALAIDVRVGQQTLQEQALIDATRLPPRLANRQWGERS